MNQLLPKFTTIGADDRPEQSAASPNCGPDHRLDRVGGRELARIDDTHLRHVKRSGETGDAGREREGEQLERLDAVTEEPGAALGIADRRHHRAEPASA